MWVTRIRGERWTYAPGLPTILSASLLGDGIIKFTSIGSGSSASAQVNNSSINSKSTPMLTIAGLAMKPASKTSVTPRSARALEASLNASRISQPAATGICSKIGSTARSSNIPVGAPFAARWIAPPRGAGVSPEIFARASAAWFTQAE